MKVNSSTGQQLLAFFVLTYLISWGIFFIGKQTNIMPLLILGVWTPSLTSLGLTWYYYGKQGIGQLLGRFKRVGVKWYWWVLLLFLPAGIHFVGRSVWQLYFHGELIPDILDMSYWLGAFLPSILIAGLGEELGWRGFALPRLQRNFSPVMASMLLAIVHLLWHMPTYWLGQGMHNVPFLFVIAFILPWTFIFNWLYNKSGGSLIFAVGFHAISNTSLSIVRFLPLESEVVLTPKLIHQLTLPLELSGPYLTVCGVYVAVALVVVLKGKFKEVNTDIP